MKMAPLNKRILDVIRSLTIISIGTMMHLYSISIIDLRHLSLPMLRANVASTFVTFSTLCILSRVRIWPERLRKPPALLLFVCELAMILSVTDLILRCIWIPCLRLLNYFFQTLSYAILDSEWNFVLFTRQQVAEWVRNEGYFLLRLLLSLIVFGVMLDITGFAANFINVVKRRRFPNPDPNNRDDLLTTFRDYNRPSNTSLRGDPNPNNMWVDEDSEDEDGESLFDIMDLPSVPPLDLLRPGYLVGQPQASTSPPERRIHGSMMR